MDNTTEVSDDLLPADYQQALAAAAAVGRSVADMVDVRMGREGPAIRVDLNVGTLGHQQILVVAPPCLRLTASADGVDDETPAESWTIGLYGASQRLSEWDGQPIDVATAQLLWGHSLFSGRWTGRIMSAFLTALSERLTEHGS